MKKASAAGAAPNRRASTMSAGKPRMRLRRVASPMTPAASTTLACSAPSVISALVAVFPQTLQHAGGQQRHHDLVVADHYVHDAAPLELSPHALGEPAT